METRYHAENVLDNLCSKSSRENSVPATLKNLYEHAVSFLFSKKINSFIQTKHTHA